MKARYISFAVLALSLYLVASGFFDNRPESYKTHHITAIEKPLDLSRQYFLDIDGNEKKFDLWNNKDTLVVFWATWCKYCKEDLPKLDAVYNELMKNDIDVIAIADPGDDAYEVKKFYQKNNIQNITLYLSEGSNLHRKARISGYPSFYVMNKHEQLAIRLRPDWEKVDSLIEAIRGVN